MCIRDRVYSEAAEPDGRKTPPLAGRGRPREAPSDAADSEPRSRPSYGPRNAAPSGDGEGAPPKLGDAGTRTGPAERARGSAPEERDAVSLARESGRA